MAERITIKDIAKSLEIHHSTVSRALRNDERVNEATRKKVRDYARKHGYQTNMVARELRGVKRNTLAVIVPNINHHFFSNVVSSLTNMASQQGYVVSVFQTNERIETERDIIDTIIQNNFSGVVASISMESEGVDHFDKLADFNIPLVMFDRVNDESEVSKVLINNAEVIKEAVALMASKGHKRIAYISGPSHINVFKERQRGYQESVDLFHMTYHKLITISSAFVMEEAKALVDDLFASSIKPDGVICDSSILAYGLMKEFKQRALRIPDDVALIVFGENPSLEVIEPAVTSIVQPCLQIAETLFELFVEAADAKVVVAPKRIVLPAEIIQRASV